MREGVAWDERGRGRWRADREGSLQWSCNPKYTLAPQKYKENVDTHANLHCTNCDKQIA